MWELDHQEAWALKNRCFWTVMLEKTLESPLAIKIKSFNPKGNQPWIFIGRIDAESEAPVLWPPDIKSRSLEKTLMLGKIEDKRRRRWQRIRWWDGIIYSKNMNLSKSWEILRDSTGEPGVLQSMGSQRVGHDLATEQRVILKVTHDEIPMNSFMYSNHGYLWSTKHVPGSDVHQWIKQKWSLSSGHLQRVE